MLSDERKWDIYVEHLARHFFVAQPDPDSLSQLLRFLGATIDHLEKLIETTE